MLEPCTHGSGTGDHRSSAMFVEIGWNETGFAHVHQFVEVLGGDGGEIVVRRPPQVPKEPPTNLVARLLPVGTLVAMAAMTVLYFSSGAAMPRSPMFLFLPVMMLVSVLGSVAHQSRGARRGGELDQDRREYLRYLDDLDRTLVKVAEAQHLSLHRRHPDPASSCCWPVHGGGGSAGLRTPTSVMCA
jgi:hypothetical protein